ncbi:hypothetical protein [Streptomyces sp. NPDC057413]|uniref:hypothetical protein n=1 Tax=Streptomyces sp. NPDC057413 TaxID=3346124 RepID=UPI003682F668
MTNDAGDVNVCGLCGQPLDADHVHEDDDLGTRIEYEVIGIRGILADSVAVHDPSDKHPLPSQVLAANLGVEATELTGLRYTCLVSRDPYGTTRSDYRLTDR